MKHPPLTLEPLTLHMGQRLAVLFGVHAQVDEAWCVSDGSWMYVRCGRTIHRIRCGTAWHLNTGAYSGTTADRGFPDGHETLFPKRYRSP